MMIKTMKSKTVDSKSNAVNNKFHGLTLRLKDYLGMLFTFKFLKFIIQSALSYGLAFLQMYIYTELIKLDLDISYALTQVFLFIFNFLVARLIVFKATEGKSYKQGIKFLIASPSFRVLDWLLFMFLATILGINQYISIFISMSVIFPIKFIVWDRKIFNKEDSPFQTSDDKKSSLAEQEKMK